MFVTVSAKVPVEVRDQVHEKLKREGSTPPQLINAAYNSFLTGELSLHSKEKNAATRLKNEEVIEIIRATTCNFDDPLPDSFDFKAELENDRINDYETARL